MTILRSSLLFLSSLLVSCGQATSQDKPDSRQEDEDFRSYWYAGTAELNRYELNQSRYGEIHPGEAVLIFVTEDFRSDQQVKYESGDRTKVEPIMKLNFTRKFYTGIYPYSMMSSIFSPLSSDKPTSKVTTSSQEWCGHTFTQLNYKKDKYEVQLNSYFQDEADQSTSIPKTILEDGIWNLIRIAPEDLPIGQIDLVPSTQFLRLKHLNTIAHTADVSLTDYTNPALSSSKMKQYTIAYQSIPRTISIIYEADFPHQILAWEEEVQKGFSGAERSKTTAVRTHSMHKAYWNHNKLNDASLREELGMNKSY